jgi:hypothetical protein
MGRSAYSGRNWEGFSPDPYLSGVTMEKSVRGLQDAGVQATAKHWLLNEQEILRNPVSYPNGTLQYEALSSNVDDRTVRKCSFLLVLALPDLRSCIMDHPFIREALVRLETCSISMAGLICLRIRGGRHMRKKRCGSV